MSVRNTNLYSARLDSTDVKTPKIPAPAGAPRSKDPMFQDEELYLEIN